MAFYLDKYTFIAIWKVKSWFIFLSSLEILCQNLAGGYNGTYSCLHSPVAFNFSLPSTSLPTEKRPGMHGMNTSMLQKPHSQLSVRPEGGHTGKHSCPQNGAQGTAQAIFGARWGPVGKKILWSQLQARSEGRSSNLATILAPRNPHLFAEEGLAEGHPEKQSETEFCLVVRVILLTSLALLAISPLSLGNQCPLKYWRSCDYDIETKVILSVEGFSSFLFCNRNEMNVAWAFLSPFFPALLLF